jgi:hypothetical protein
LIFNLLQYLLFHSTKANLHQYVQNAPYRSPFTLSRNIPEHLKVTTFLGFIIIFSPVAGFRPLRSRLSLTQNFPNPEIRTSSPDARVDLIISRIFSIVSEDFLRVNPFCCGMVAIKWDFVRAMGSAPSQLKK